MLKLLIFSLISFAVTGFAQEPEESFRKGRARNVDNRDSVRSGSISMGRISYGGNGCPQGSLSATLSPDSKAISILYDEFILELGDSAGVLNQKKTCHLRIPIHVPRGLKASVVALDYRGYHFLDEKTRLRLNSQYFFQNRRRPDKAGAVTRRNMVVRGPIDEEYVISSELKQRRTRKRSDCGEDFILNVVNDLHGTSRGNDLFATVDSLDAVGKALGNSEVRYHLTWETCEPGRLELDERRERRELDRDRRRAERESERERRRRERERERRLRRGV